MTSHPVTLYRNGRFYSAADPRATAMLVRDGRIAWLGQDADAPAADVAVDVAGALVTPAFVDAHIHATDTGLATDGLDLSAVRSAHGLLDAVAAFAATRPADAVVLGHGWDESMWADPALPGADALAIAGGGRRVYLTQASMHAALVTGAGLVTEDEHHEARAAALGSLTAAQRTAAQRTALRLAASRGVAAVHECGGPGTSSEADFRSVLGLRAPDMPEVTGYWGELGGAAKALELGAAGAAGDLYADGALGSRTASLRSPYSDAPGCGEAFVSAEAAGSHILDCVSVGVQAGFHAIGDAAIEQVLAGFAIAAKAIGVDRLREGRHRVEHLELADKAMIAGLVEFGLIASVQPVFDALWGGPDRMYATALGVERALASNPIGAMHATGVTLAFGSDSPVTRLDPWAAVAAAAGPRNPAYRMSVRAAFAASTRGGWRAAGRDGAASPGLGSLAPGAEATFAVWDTPAGVQGGLPVLEADGVRTPAPRCRRTVRCGVTIYEE